MQRRSSLRRSTALKRTGALSRTATLKASRLVRTPLRSSQAEREAARRFWEDVCLDERGAVRPCVVCGAKARDAHHVLAKQRIKAAAKTLRWSEEETLRWVYDAADGIALCRACHDGHEGASERLAYSVIPAAALAFVAALDEMTGTQAATGHINEHYRRSHGD